MIYNGHRENIEAEEILLSRWKIPEIIGVKATERPSLIYFNNELDALRLLDKHIGLKSNIAIHFDVDFDGIASGYIMHKELNRRGLAKQLKIINKDKEHGIKEKHVEYINNNRSCELLIIVDSSSKDIETIKEFKCDVLVIDHHDTDGMESYGVCNDGEHVFVVVNSTIEASDFEKSKYEIDKLKIETLKRLEKCAGTQKMSCGLVVYEIVRLWYTLYNDLDHLESERIYQWAAASLFTDDIDLIDERNQWYIQRMESDKTIDVTLMKIGEAVSKYGITLDKSFIQFKLAPLINKAIRANAGGEVIDKIINNTSTIGELVKYDVEQKRAIEIATKNLKADSKEYVMLNITGSGISKTYNGVIAARICGDNDKNTVVYECINGIYKGSFRGRIKEFNYREECFIDCVLKADGHPNAFGFEAASEEDIAKAMNRCIKSEPIGQHVNHLVSLGNVEDDMRGLYHIETLDELRMSRLLLMLAYGNANVSSSDEIQILASVKDLVMVEGHDKYYKYKLMGDLDIVSFETLHGTHFSIYAEYGTEIRLYGRNM